jgi:hypothetical protein
MWPIQLTFLLLISWRIFLCSLTLNGLVLFTERRNMVSARVPSHFKRSLQPPPRSGGR